MTRSEICQRVHWQSENERKRKALDWNGVCSGWRPLISHKTSKNTKVILVLSSNIDFFSHRSSANSVLYRDNEGNGPLYFTESQILDYFVQIWLGMWAIHSKNIIHRDIKSLNIFITEEGILKIGDFGTSKQLEETLQVMQTFVGTPLYLAPEVIRHSYDIKADIWSLGVLLFELWWLHHPFLGRDLAEINLRILNHTKLPRLPEFLSEDIKDLLSDLLIADPTLRPSINDIFGYPIIQNALLHYFWRYLFIMFLIFILHFFYANCKKFLITDYL